MSIDLQVLYRQGTQIQRQWEAVAREEFEDDPIFDPGFDLERHEQGRVRFTDGAFMLSIDIVGNQDREERLRHARNGELKRLLNAASHIARMNSSADGYEAMWAAAGTLALAASGAVYDPQDGKWFSGREAIDRLGADTEADEQLVHALCDELQERRAQGYSPGPHGVLVSDIGDQHPYVAQFLIMGAAGIDEGDAFNIVINTPFELLPKSLSKRDASWIVKTFKKAKVTAEVI